MSISCNSTESKVIIRCTGSIIDHQHILTSANCIQNCELSYLIGHSTIFYKYIEVIESDAAYFHPDFDATTHEYDVAVIRTEPKKLVSAKWPIPVAKPFTDQLIEAQVLTSQVKSVGWGLATVQRDVFKFNRGEIIKKSNESNECFLRVNFTTDPGARFYDNGSPLIAEIDGQWTQIGVATGSNDDVSKVGLFVSVFCEAIYLFISSTLKDA